MHALNYLVEFASIRVNNKYFFEDNIFRINKRSLEKFQNLNASDDIAEFLLNIEAFLSLFL